MRQNGTVHNSEPDTVEISGEENLAGAGGVLLCNLMELFQTVAVVGGGDVALEDALYLEARSVKKCI